MSVEGVKSEKAKCLSSLRFTFSNDTSKIDVLQRSGTKHVTCLSSA